MVGMRYQPAYNKSKISHDDVLILIREPENQVNSDAIAVHFPKQGSILGSGTKIGYIRDADLWGMTDLDVVDQGIYKVSRICTNYLKLDFVSQEAIKQPASEFYDAGKLGQWSVPTNSCKEVYESRSQTKNNGATPRAWLDEQYSSYFKNASSPDEYNTSMDRAFKLAKQAAVSEQKTQPIKEKKMINTNNMRDSFFKEVKNVALDFQTGKLGITTKDGLITATDDGVSVNPIVEMGFNIPAFAMRVPVDGLTKGDIIISSGDPVFFIEGNKTGYVTMTTSGVVQETGVVSNMFFGKNTVMAVKNMFGDAGAGGMNPMMLMMMMGDDKGGAEGFDFKKMMMFQMMSGQKGSEGMNPMLMAMMFSKM